LRWNPHFHCLVLEGGFDDRGKFVHIPLGDIQRMSGYFRRVVTRFFLKKELLNAHQLEALRLFLGPFDLRSSVFD
jgi:hypothetical protein